VGFWIDPCPQSLHHEQVVPLHMVSREEWIEEMLKLNRHHGVKILGGCCGTDDNYLRGLVAGTVVTSCGIA
jgi:methionine synthase I (cobalamin-dependent)